MSEESPGEENLYTTKNEPTAVFWRGKSVNVDAETDAHHGHTSWLAPPRAASMASAKTRSSGEVSLMLDCSPATTSTRPPSRSTREASSVAARRYSSGESWRRRSRPRRNAWGVWTAHRFV